MACDPTLSLSLPFCNINVVSNLISSTLKEAAALRQQLAADSNFIATVEKAGQMLLASIKAGGTITTCGNGGSACDAMHFAEELVALYKRDRPGIRARHLLDAGTITCWGNDRSFDGVFARQIETLCAANDVLVAFSTSGNSKNIISAIEAAKRTKTPIIGVLGKGGGKATSLCDLSIVVPSDDTARIQELHITLVHLWCEVIETTLYPK